MKDHNNKVYFMTCCVMLVALLCFSATTLLNHTLAWFAENSSVYIDGIGFNVVDNEKCKLATRGTYDDLLQNYTLEDKTFGQGTLQDGYYVADSSMLIKLRTDDDPSGNAPMNPTSTGRFTFFIISKENAIGETVKILLDLSGYAESESVLVKPLDGGNQDLLKGHILFFKSKTGDTYSGLLEDGVLQVEITDSIVEVTVYWIWEGLFSNYTNGDSWDQQDYDMIVRSITRDIDNVQSDDHYNSRFFAQLMPGDMYIDQNQEGQEWRGENIEWSRKAYLSDKYNEADQMIGIVFDFILLEIMIEQ